MARCLGSMASAVLGGRGLQQAPPGSREEPESHSQDKLSLWFRARQEEDAFVRSQWDSTLRTSMWMSILMVIVSLFDIVRYGRYWARGEPDDDDAKAYAKGLHGQTYVAFLAFQVALGTGLLLLTRYLRKKGDLNTRLQVTCSRVIEAAWLSWLLALSAYLLFMFCHPMSLDEECAVAESHQQAYCKERRALLKAKIALALDLALAPMHLCLPIRWFVTLPFDALVLASFTVISFWDPLVEDRLGTLFIPVAFAALVICYSIGMRTREHAQRTLFSTVTTERVMRVKAEFSAEVNGRMPDREFDREPAYCARDGTVHTSAPTTTATGKAFQRLAAGSADARKELLELATQGHWLVHEDELEIFPEHVLGEGSFGQVVTGRFCCSLVAVKIATKVSKEHASINELRVFRQVRHPNIALFHGVSIPAGRDELHLVMERITGVTMTNFIKLLSDASAPFEAKDVRRRACLMQGVVQALAYLHSRSPVIVHSDLKASNVMVEMCNMEPRSKLLDFGLSRVVTRHAVVNGGAKVYMAPELFKAKQGCKARPSVDIWSLGKLLIFVASGTRPKSGPPRPSEWLPGNALVEEWHDMIMACLCEGPESRPSAVEVHDRLFQRDCQSLATSDVPGTLSL